MQEIAWLCCSVLTLMREAANLSVSNVVKKLVHGAVSHFRLVQIVLLSICRKFFLNAENVSIATL